ncbi:MAG: protein kinase [Kofleriaceae bacterium]
MQDSSTERVGRYQLLEPIGGGPDGSVWRAKVFGVAGFERQFAIKRFLPELAAAPASAQALSAAARSYGSLEHPRIARMSEFGVAQGQTFTAVELVIGLDLQRLVAESRLGIGAISAGGSLALISQAARAVGYAHGRGLSHLGLSPTNVIVTVDGDVKVTDFGILAAALPAKPVDAPRLAQRIGYLAPEQIAGEATSAATDVFVLGVIAYELVTGQRAFFGDAPHAIANAILAGPPAEPPLPRPIVRVLSRCLARSQFERFPDARAFADALDAALRVAPVPGTRKDIGGQIKAVLDRHAAMNEGNLSGMVALNLGLRPRHDEPEGGTTTPFVRPDVEVARPMPLVGLGPRSEPATIPNPPKPLTTTMPGLAAPPIPSPGTPPPIPSPATKTIMGLARPAIPQIKPKSSIPSVVPAALRPIAGLPSVPPGARPLSGPIPTLRQTQPGAGTPPAPTRTEEPAAPVELDEFGRPRSKLIGPTPGLGAPGRPPSNPGSARPDSELDRGLELDAELETLPGSTLVVPSASSPDFDTATDAATRPGEFARSESDFSDLSEADPAATVRATAARTHRDTLGDDPPTAPHDVLPEVHARGGLKPFVPSFAASEPTHTSPSIEIIREADAPEPARAKRPSNLPTSEMSHAQVQELKRAAIDDPLIELAIEAHTVGAIEIHDGNQVNLAARGTTPPPPGAANPGAPNPSAPNPPNPGAPNPSAPNPGAPNPGATLFGVGKAGEPPPRPRMPSPTPPSLLPPGMMPPEVRVGSTPHLTSGLAPGTAPAPGTVQSLAPPPPRPLGPPAFQSPAPPTRKPSRLPLAIGALVVIGAGAAVVTWRVMRHDGDGASSTTGSASAPVPSTGSGSGSGASNARATGSGAAAIAVAPRAAAPGAAAPGAATSVAATGSGAAAIAVTPRDAAPAAAATTGSPAGTSDALQIASTPGGARVFIDGADQGVTPIKLAGSADRHTMALFLPAHDLYVAEVDGHGAFSVALKSITPSGGPAGIKVIKCKDKDRYYVFVDGKPTGMACPTERIECTTGPHTVEVYDLVTETRRKWDITVRDTRLSYRVRVD